MIFMYKVTITRPSLQQKGSEFAMKSAIAATITVTLPLVPLVSASSEEGRIDACPL